MGLLPKDEYDTKFKVYDGGIGYDNFNTESATLYRSISVNDIIEVEGERKYQ